MSRNARFALQWSNDEGPRSVIVKLPSAEAPTRELAFTHNLYRNECEFYRSMEPLVDIAVPESLAIHLDIEGCDFAIVLEDMTNSEQGDHFSEPTETQVALAIEQAVALHAPLWGQTERSECDFMRLDRDDRAEMMQGLISAFLPAVFDRLGDGLEPEVVDHRGWVVVELHFTASQTRRELPNTAVSRRLRACCASWGSRRRDCDDDGEPD